MPRVVWIQALLYIGGAILAEVLTRWHLRKRGNHADPPDPP